MTKRFVLAMTGASGSAYGLRTLQVLLQEGHTVHVTVSPSAVQVLQTELDIEVDLDDFDFNQILPDGEGELFKENGQLFYHHYRDFFSGIASGSFLTDGMLICPCSMGTLASIANGISTNLIHRSADVHLKEGRKLIVVPRETPLGSIQLGNMKTLADAGGVILPAMPGFYQNPKSIEDLIDFVVARICDQLGVSHSLMERWGEKDERVDDEVVKPSQFRVVGSPVVEADPLDENLDLKHPK